MLFPLFKKSAPVSGRFNCNATPANLRKLGVVGGGLLFVFVPPQADFARVNSDWQRLAHDNLSVIALSSTWSMSTILTARRQLSWPVGGGE